MLKPSTYFAYITTSNQTAHILGYSYARLLFCRGSLTPGSFIPRLPIPGFLKPVYIQIRQGMSAVSNLRVRSFRKGCSVPVAAILCSAILMQRDTSRGQCPARHSPATLHNSASDCIASAATHFADSCDFSYLPRFSVSITDPIFWSTFTCCQVRCWYVSILHVLNVLRVR
jgi:hypothetical protein